MNALTAVAPAHLADVEARLSEPTEPASVALATFPLHPILRDADGTPRCACAKGARCKSIGKCPAFPYSELEAGEQLAGPPEAPGDPGYGVATGLRSGVFVVDLDDRPADGKDGVAVFQALADANGGYPCTLSVLTPTKGVHLYFRNPPGMTVRNSTGGRKSRIGHGVDIRGEGGFVVGPGSPHKNGGTYEVIQDLPAADAPTWLLDLLEEAHPAPASEASPITPIDVSTPEGARRIGLARVYLEKTAKPSIKGDDGSTAMLRVCIHLAARLALPLATCKDLINELYGPRCIPPNEWDMDGKLDRKLAEALKSKAARTIAAEHRAKDSMMGKRQTPAAETAPTADAATADAANDTTAPTVGPNGIPWEREAYTDTGNARRFIRLHGDKLRYVHTWGKWIAWDGKRWADGDQGRPLALTEDVCRDIVLGAGSEDENHGKWSKATQARGRREAIVGLAQCDSRISISHEVLDRKALLLNVANGTIDLTTGTLRPHEPGDLLRQLSPVVYDPSATCPTWTAFLERIFRPHPELAAYMQRAIGYSLTADVSEQCLFFLVGKGSNGKSTLTGALLRLLGDAGTAMDRSILIAKHNDNHPAGIAALAGARVAVCGELPKGKPWDEATVKGLSGGDRVPTRNMGENWWQLEPTAKIWIHANDRPTVKGSDHGIWRRFRLVPMDVRIEGADMDPKLPEKLAAELPGILNWAIAGCLEWQRTGLQTPDVVKAATDAYRKDMDVVGEFVEDRCEVDPQREVSRASLYQSFRLWWDAQSPTPAMNAKEFAGRLRDKVPDLGEKMVQGERRWVGVAVRSTAPVFASARP